MLLPILPEGWGVLLLAFLSPFHNPTPIHALNLGFYLHWFHILTFGVLNNHWVWCGLPTRHKTSYYFFFILTKKHYSTSLRFTFQVNRTFSILVLTISINRVRTWWSEEWRCMQRDYHADVPMSYILWYDVLRSVVFLLERDWLVGETRWRNLL